MSQNVCVVCLSYPGQGQCPCAESREREALLRSARQRLAVPAPGGRTAPLTLTAPLSRVAGSSILFPSRAERASATGSASRGRRSPGAEPGPSGAAYAAKRPFRSSTQNAASTPCSVPPRLRTKSRGLLRSIAHRNSRCSCAACFAPAEWRRLRRPQGERCASLRSFLSERPAFRRWTTPPYDGGRDWRFALF